MEFASPLMRRFAAAISPAASIEHGGGADAIACDDNLLRQILKSEGPATRLRLWINDPCLVTTRRLAAHPNFGDASGRSANSGWPVHVRTSGGSTVVHRPGILNVSLLQRVGGGPRRVDEYYAPLISHLSLALDAVGVRAEAGRREGSYCDGAFNILSGDRKIAGTSCRVIRSGGALAVLAHAVVWVEGDVSRDIAAITRFETDLGLGSVYAPEHHTTIEGALRTH